MARQTDGALVRRARTALGGSAHPLPRQSGGEAVVTGEVDQTGQARADVVGAAGGWAEVEIVGGISRIGTIENGKEIGIGIGVCLHLAVDATHLHDGLDSGGGDVRGPVPVVGTVRLHLHAGEIRDTSCSTRTKPSTKKVRRYFVRIVRLFT